jgi:hypothetical protein
MPAGNGSDSYISEFNRNLSRMDGSEPLNLLALKDSDAELDRLREVLKVSPQVSTEAFRSRLNALADQLQVQLQQIQKQFDDEHKAQGPIGRAFDAAKNYVGTNGEGDLHSTPGWLWAQMLNRNNGSEASQEALQSSSQAIGELKSAAAENDLVRFGSIYKGLTGKEFNQNTTTAADPLQVKRNVETYRTSQDNGVEFIADLGAIAASLAALRLGQGTRACESLYARLATGFAAGSASKGLLKQVDRRYASLPVDLVTGGITGVAFPVAQRAGLAFSGAALKHGIGVVAGVENASRSTVIQVRENHHVDGYKLLNDAVTGYGIGYASATALLGSLSVLAGRARDGSSNLPACRVVSEDGLRKSLARFR